MKKFVFSSGLLAALLVLCALTIPQALTAAEEIKPAPTPKVKDEAPAPDAGKNIAPTGNNLHLMGENTIAESYAVTMVGGDKGNILVAWTQPNRTLLTKALTFSVSETGKDGVMVLKLEDGKVVYAKEKDGKIQLVEAPKASSDSGDKKAGSADSLKPGATADTRLDIATFGDAKMKKNIKAPDSIATTVVPPAADSAGAKKQ